ncbi:Phloem protein [Trema orientale]|uniref:Phloem protein n=1 Tax=Trema orientale TaxID=63057 RepID=A0A2P5FYW4_TREOI|nr:Phloem protein [Trema orientale]
MAKTVDLDQLPEGCIEDIISLTTPRDACRLCLVSPFFRSVAQSDAVWERLLPPDCLSILSRSVDPPPLPLPSKKDLYFSLCDQPVLIDQGRKSFSLDKESGKKCFMISARELSIVWGDTPMYWSWIPFPESRFEDVAELIDVCWLEIRGKIDVSLLSPSTLYTAILVFKSTEEAYGFSIQAGKGAVGLAEGEKLTRKIVLDVKRRQGQSRRRNRRQRRNRNLVESQRGRDDELYYPRVRGDGWMETELGEFFCDGGQEGELEMSIMDLSSHWKSGLIVQGIEIRPKRV